MIVAGMLAGNPVPKIIARALVGLVFGFILGSLSGWIAATVARENAKTGENELAESSGTATPPASASAPGSPDSPARRAA